LSWPGLLAGAGLGLLLVAPACAQTPDSTATPAAPDTTADVPKRFQVRGYLKDLQFVTLPGRGDSIGTGNLLHHRLNVRWYPSTPLTVAVEVRTRLFVGEQVRNTPGFAHLIDQGNSYADLSGVLLNRRSVVLHSIVDRAWVGWEKGPWDVRLGRQRINWGVNLAWNPNDLFNAYNFLDFDYEERPGSDALRVRYATGTLSDVELALRPGRHPGQTVGALKYGWNVREYDIQVLGGVYQRDAVLGLGWAGNLGEAGFKGEASYFRPYRRWLQRRGTLSFSTTVDYTLSGGIYLQAAYLYNGGGGAPLQASTALTSVNLSPKNLFFTRHALLAQVQKEASPVLRLALSVIYSPNYDVLITQPTLSYSLQENWDLDLIGQSFWARLAPQPFQDLGHAIYLRLKWSY
jgi:hypothetical protein